MTEISWIKLKTKMFDDEKIQLIESMPEADAILVIWVKLLIQAGKTNCNGFVILSENIPLTNEMLATIFRRSLPIVKFALKILNEMGMIEINERNMISITNWDKHQNISGLEKIRESNKLRVAKFREKQRLLDKCNVSVTLPVTLPSISYSNSISNSLFKEVTEKIRDKKMSVQDWFNDEYKLITKDYFVELIPVDASITFIEYWVEWVDYRKDIKKKLTKASAKKQMEFLLKQDNPVACINESIKNQWQGLFEIKGNNNGTYKSGNGNNRNKAIGDFNLADDTEYKYETFGKK